MDELDVKDYLIRNDGRFRELAEQHQAYERQLQQFLEKPYLSVQEQFQEAVIKKKKLALKDQMQAMISRFQTEHSAG